MTIKFGTDGWRGKIGDTFTDANLKVVAQATCDFLLNQPRSNDFVVIGYDRRFRSEEYAALVADIFASNGFEVLLSIEPVSTPVVSFVTNRFKASLGICITASHNPPQYNGYKIKENFGGSALTSTIEKVIPYLKKAEDRQYSYGNSKKISKIDMTADYFANLRSLFNLDTIAYHFRDMPVHLNYMHGSSAGYVGEIFKGNYIPTYEYNLNHDPYFGGFNPEPIPANLVDFLRDVRSGAGFAFDGDGDRIAAATPTGRFVSSSQLMALLIPYLSQKHSANRVVSTVSCSSVIKAVASRHRIDMTTTKIGFKYIADEILKGPPVLIGGEESGGIGFYGYLPERDGIANCLLVLDALTTMNTTLEAAIEDLDEEYGSYFQDRIDLHLPKIDDAVHKKISLFESEPSFLIKNPVTVENTDGIKVTSEDGSWLMIRPSGTEPVVRLYAESSDKKKTSELLERTRSFLQT